MNAGSSSAAGALEKVTGVSVVGGGFVFVRGLGERYSSTQLNGALIPTTEPEKRSEMMKSAEKILVDDCVGIFVYHQLHGYLYKPYLKGDILLPNSYGYTGLQWPGLGTATLSLGDRKSTRLNSSHRT